MPSCSACFYRCRLCVSRPCVVRNCSERGYRRRNANGRDAGWVAVAHFGNRWHGVGWHSALLYRWNWVFAVNALCFFVVIVALLQWKRAEAESQFSLENFFESFSTAIRYVRYSPAIQVVLAAQRTTVTHP
jgi:hypothetical protein